MNGPLVDQLQVIRILDANANRAAEGLRTLDEVARLVRQDVWASAQIKSLRHSLAEIVDRIPRQLRLQARSAATDAGTELTTEGEVQRGDWQAVIAAAAERVGQSLRCLEEFGKFIDVESAQLFKNLRYQAYDVLAQVELRLNSSNRLASAHLYVLVDCQQPIAQFVDYVRKLVDHGADVLQIRDKQLDDRQLVRYTQAAMTAVVGTAASVIVNDRADIAHCADASGVHLGQEDLPVESARRILGYNKLVGVSTHSIEQAEDAQQRGADYIGVGPTFPSTTKQFSEFTGLALIRAVTERIHIPTFAIGGIAYDNLPEVLDAGANGIAVSSAIHNAVDPFESTRKLAQSVRARRRESGCSPPSANGESANEL